jgi:surface antigen
LKGFKNMSENWMNSVAQDSEGWYYRITKSYGALSTSQKENNAILFYKYFSNTMTLAAIAGILGNIERESQLNPGQVEGDSQYNVGWSDLQRGHGFIQWTNSSNPNSNPLVSWKDGATNNKWASGTFQCYRIACEGSATEGAGGTWIKNTTMGYTYTWEEFCNLNNYEEATKAYLHERERAGVAALSDRLQYAKKWYDFLKAQQFTPRLDDTDTSVLNSPYWKSSLNGRGGLNYNTAIEDWPNAQSGWTETDKQNIKGTYTTLPNCTSWAWGRAYEIMGEAPPRFTGDAGNWWNSYDVLNTNNALVNKGYYKSSTPSLGAIACWQDPDNPTSMGHVAIVEKIYDNGNISFSESGYQTWVWRPSYFNVQDNKDPNVAYSSKYKFVGYISLPSFGGGLSTIDSFEFIEARTEEADFQISITENGGSISRSYYTLNTGVTGDLNLTGGDNTFTIRNLVPNTDYTISVTLEANGGSVTSNTVSFKTKQDYPDGVKNIKIQSVSKNLETSSFKVNVEAPDRWGYWQRIGNEYGYKVFIIEDSKLISNYNDTSRSNNFYITPNSKNVKHGKNFQIGISTWVTDNDDIKVFALPGEEFPVGSNSVLLKDISEMSDTWFIISNSKINRVQPYFKKTKTSKPKPLNVYKL